MVTAGAGVVRALQVLHRRNSLSGSMTHSWQRWGGRGCTSRRAASASTCLSHLWTADPRRCGSTQVKCEISVVYFGWAIGTTLFTALWPLGAVILARLGRRFSLHTLLVVVALLSIGLGALA